MNRLMYFQCNRTQSDIIDRDTLAPYWSPPFTEYKISGYSVDERDGLKTARLVYRDQITGKLTSKISYNLGGIESKNQKNVYGHSIFTTTENLVSAGYKWISNLKTYVHQTILHEFLDVDECINESGNRSLLASEIPDSHEDYCYSEIQNIHVHDDQARSINGGNDYVSQSYYDDNYFTCDGCNHTYHNDDYSEDGYCRECDSENQDTPSRSDYGACAVEAYGFYNGKGQSNKWQNGKRYFGLEIEIELNSTDDVSPLRDDIESAELALGCEDGSLTTDCGLEIKTPPLLAGHCEEYLSRLYKIIDKYDYSTNDGTGLHVNVSRDSVTNLTIGKVICFLHHPKNADFIASIAERKSCHWADFKTLKDIKSDLRSDSLYMCSSKYTACNVKDTVLEFRIFHGIENMKSAIKAIEFCDSLINYCAAQSVIKATSGRLTHDDFKTWLYPRRKQYPKLSDFIFGKLPLFEQNSQKEREIECA